MVADNNIMNVDEDCVNKSSEITDAKNSLDKENEVRNDDESQCDKPLVDESKERSNVNANDGSDNKGKKVFEKGISGVVRWFNVKVGYGFIKRNDTNEDIYVYYKSIAKKNPSKRLKSLATDEEVMFDVIEGRKGYEAGNVTGPNGEPVKGSHIDTRFKKSYKSYRKIPYYYKKFNMKNKERDPNQEYVEEKVEGKVLFFNFYKGYGFIKRNDNGESVFCHIMDIVKKNPKKFSYLPSGTPVVFDIVNGLKGNEAAFVTNEEGKPISGIKKRNRKSKKVKFSSTNSSKENEKMKKDDINEIERKKQSRKNRKNGKNKKTEENKENESQMSSEKENMVSTDVKNDGSTSNNNLMVENKTTQPRSDVSLMTDALENLII